VTANELAAILWFGSGFISLIMVYSCNYIGDHMDEDNFYLFALLYFLVILGGPVYMIVAIHYMVHRDEENNGL